MNSLLRVAPLTAVLSLTLISSVGAQGGSATGACGSIPVTGGQARFEAFVDLRDVGMPRGYLVYRDPANNFRMRSTSITSYSTSGCTAQFSGDGDSNFGPVQFSVTVTDGGEPGGNDEFAIEVTGATQYAAGENLEDGEIARIGPTCP
jgi:hypothetical protein